MKEYDMNDPESKTSFMNEVAKKCLTFDNEIMVMVEDSGPGIPENKLETIFEKGYSSKGPRRGIGLFLIKQTVTHLKGTIEVESTVGEGTTFTIRLPIVRTVKTS